MAKVAIGLIGFGLAFLWIAFGTVCIEPYTMGTMNGPSIGALIVQGGGAVVTGSVLLIIKVFTHG